MSKTERLQVLIEREQRERLEREAAARHTSVATLVRTAIDIVYPNGLELKRAAAEAILAAEPMDMGTPEDLRRELDELRGSRH